MGSITNLARAMTSDSNSFVNDRHARCCFFSDERHSSRIVAHFRVSISATTPFQPDERTALRSHAASVLRRYFPECEAEYARRGWPLPRNIDRVDVNERARAELGWRPWYDFSHVLGRLARGLDHQSPLSRQLGSKSYHRAAPDE
jgi:UDP-glucose 4-epimerase